MAAGTTCPCRVPRVERVSPGLAFVESDERPGMHYRTSPDRCTCPNYQLRSREMSWWRCKHMELAFPIRCAICGTNQVPAAGDVCGWCAEDMRQYQLERFVGVDAPAGLWPWRD